MPRWSVLFKRLVCVALLLATQVSFAMSGASLIQEDKCCDPHEGAPHAQVIAIHGHDSLEEASIASLPCSEASHDPCSDGGDCHRHRCCSVWGVFSRAPQGQFALIPVATRFNAYHFSLDTAHRRPLYRPPAQT